MARKRKQKQVTAQETSNPVDSGVDLSQENGLPLPEGEEPVTQSNEATIHASEEASLTGVVGVSDAEPEIASEAADVPNNSEATASVFVRAMCDLVAPPNFGPCNFAEMTGKEQRTGKLIRGVFKNGYVYKVPSFVASALVERNWAMRI